MTLTQSLLIIAALIVAAVMLRSGMQLLGRSSRVLLEAAPLGVDPVAVHVFAAVAGAGGAEDARLPLRPVEQRARPGARSCRDSRPAARSAPTRSSGSTR